MHILHIISQCKDKTNFGQLIEYNKRYFCASFRPISRQFWKVLKFLGFVNPVFCEVSYIFLNLYYFNFKSFISYQSLVYIRCFRGIVSIILLVFHLLLSSEKIVQNRLKYNIFLYLKAKS